MSKELSDHNPFASPMTDERPAVPGAIEPTEAERIRKEYLNHEASVRSIGVLFYLGVIALVVFTIAAIAAIVSGEPVGVFEIVVTAILAFLGVAQWWVARGLRKLNGAVRPWAIALAALGLINVPIGTLFSIYFIWVLASAKGKFVMSPEYQEIRAATPHIKYKMSRIVWVLLGLIVLLVVGVIIGALLSGS